MRQVVVYRGEDGYWVAECPSLPGCISQGKTKEEAISNIREAIRGYVAALEEDISLSPKRNSTPCWLPYERLAANIRPRVH